jgi:ribulose-phosphate 3-epimerase
MKRNISICPTVTIEKNKFEEQIEVITKFSDRIHIDVTDGKFAPSNITKLDQITIPKGKKVDIHVMYERPVTQLRKILAMEPNLVIIHAEASGYFLPFISLLHKFDIAAGLALLPETKVQEIKPALKALDHVLIFSGNLGYQGGKADLKLLEKAKELKKLKPGLEIGWDGGVNLRNAKKILDAGVSVLNVGGYISNAKNPGVAYVKLKALAESYK